MAGNSIPVEFTLTPEGDERTRLRVVESGHEVLAWPGAAEERYAGEHQGGWAEHLDRLAILWPGGRPTAQWPRLAAGRSDDLTAGP